MSLATSLDPRQLGQLADEVDPLLERLRESSLEASRAMGRGNLLDLVRAMQERERVFLRAAPLLDELRVRWKVARENAGGAEGGLERVEASVSRILHTLNGVRVSDLALMAEVEELRSFTETELGHVKRQRVEQAGYAEISRTGTNLDLRR
jgi:hypothetical protein